MDVELRAFSQQRERGGWRSAIFIIFVEMAERFAYYGIVGNLIMYLTTVLEEPVAEAAKNVNSFNGVSSLSMLLGAFIADSYLGRFKTTLLSSSLFLLGLILLTITSSKIISESTRTTLFFIALYITAAGEGGHKPCVQTFAADQFDEDTPDQKKAKSSFFNWWFLGIVVGSTTAVLVVVYVEDNYSWTIGYFIPTAALAMALAVFLVGTATYRKQRPVGSPFTRVAQVVVAAVRKRRVFEMRGVWMEDHGLEEENGVHVQKLARTTQFRFLDKAMMIDDQDASNKTRNPWRLCSVNQVEEVKLLLRLLPIWACTFPYAIIVAQVHTFFIKQGSTMDRYLPGHKLQVPPASLQVIIGITILTFVPLYERVLVTIIRKHTNIPSGINALQRIGVGLALSVLTIVTAALVEAKRVAVASHNGLLDNPKAIVPMSIWWLIPQFMVMGLSDLFAYVGIQELFYDQMPESMRSMGSALTNATIGVGAIMSSGIIVMVQEVTKKWSKSTWLVNNLNRAHLDSFYWVLAAFCSLDLVVYVFVAKWFVWKKTQG